MTGPEPVRASVFVPAPPDRAFRRFTAEIGTWWPRETHSVHGLDVEAVTFECREGGRIFERARDGTEAHWGTVTEWRPPERVAFTWHPGRVTSRDMRVEVDFRPVGEGTVVDLRHSGWASLGEGWRDVRRRYDDGWTSVLGRLAAHLETHS